jgi:hypothetical protein
MEIKKFGWMDLIQAKSSMTVCGVKYEGESFARAFKQDTAAAIQQIVTDTGKNEESILLLLAGAFDEMRKARIARGQANGN